MSWQRVLGPNRRRQCRSSYHCFGSLAIASRCKPLVEWSCCWIEQAPEQTTTAAAAHGPPSVISGPNFIIVALGNDGTLLLVRLFFG